MFILKGSVLGLFLEAWYPLLIMSAAIICVFMNSSFSSVPRRFTYAILRNKSSSLVDFTIKFNQTTRFCLCCTYLYHSKKNIPSHLGAQKAEKHTWSRLSPAFQSCPLEEDSGKPFIAGQVTPKIHLRISGILNPTEKVACIFFIVFSFIKAFFLRQVTRCPVEQNTFFLTETLSNPRFCRHTAHLFSRLATTDWTRTHRLPAFKDGSHLYHITFHFLGKLLVDLWPQGVGAKVISSFF